MEAKRVEVNFDYTTLYMPFIRAMAEIGKRGTSVYGYHNYRLSPLWEDKSPLNHALGHITRYMDGEKHKHFGTRKHELAAAAFNLMIEFFWSVQDEKATQAEIKRESDSIEKSFGAFAPGTLMEPDYELMKKGGLQPAAPAQEPPSEEHLKYIKEALRRKEKTYTHQQFPTLCAKCQRMLQISHDPSTIYICSDCRANELDEERRRELRVEEDRF